MYMQKATADHKKEEENMIIHYRASGKDRKKLAEIVAKEIGVDAIYQGAPTFSYQMDYFTVDREGALVFDDELTGDESERVLDRIAAAGFTQDEGEDEMEEKTGLAIQMPAMTGDEISRLEQLIESKESLIKKAIGADSLAVGEKDGKLDFAWFKADAEPDEVKAYMDLVTALCEMAKKATRVTGKDKPVENEKYAFRCFLLRLGFIGDEYKASRKVLLKNFSGSSAFKNGGASHEISE